jgi:uncharacterized delta-60 repeat protein
MHEKGSTFNQIIFTSLLLFGVITTYSQGVDTSYTPVPGPGTPVTTAIVLQSDGKAIVAGAFQTINGTGSATIARLNTDGTPDSSFSPGSGFSGGDVTKLYVQGDGKILAFGTFTAFNSTARVNLARINSDGTLDTGFTPSISNVKNIVLAPDGKIYLLGTTLVVNTVSRTGVARLNSDGTLDTSFLVILGDPDMHDCVAHPDGRVTVVGSFNGLNGNNNWINSARFFPDGTHDTSFNGGVQVFHRVALQPDGKYILASTIGALPLWRFGANGLPQDTSFNATGAVKSGGIETITTEADGGMILAGSFTTGQPRIVRLDPVGVPDVQYAAPGANGNVNGFAIQADRKVIAVGAFTSVAGAAKPGIARINFTNFAARTPFDFDGDGKADISVTRNTDMMWYRLTSTSYVATQHGAPGDKVVPGDYDGDGKTDIAVFHPQTGEWIYIASQNSTLVTVQFGQNGDIPVPGDFTNDGRDDYLVIRNFQWLMRNNATGQFSNLGNLGATGDDPMTGDFDGDGRADRAVFRRATGQWLYYPSTVGGGIEYAVHWGNSSDIPVPADYDGDNKTDFAVFRASEGKWYVLNSSNGSYLWLQFGISTDRPIPADYDGDGKADIAVYRPAEGFWYLLQTTGGYTGYRWGLDIDIPTPAAYIPAS